MYQNTHFEIPEYMGMEHPLPYHYSLNTCGASILSPHPQKILNTPLLMLTRCWTCGEAGRLSTTSDSHTLSLQSSKHTVVKLLLIPCPVRVGGGVGVNTQ